MPADGQQDIVDRIDDALTDDAASWNANGDHPQPWWSTPEPGAMTAIALNMTGAKPIDISETDPAGDIARHVGDPQVARISQLNRVQFWVGGDSSTTSPINDGATRMLHQLLADIRDGRYVAGDEERNHIQALLDTPGTLPVIHGPCLITGVGDGGAAAPLDENFQTWLTALLDDIAETRTLLTGLVVGAIGIPMEQLDDVIVVVHLE